MTNGKAKTGFPFITAAVALVFIMVGGAVAWGVQKCGDTDFSISVRDGLHLMCKASTIIETTRNTTDKGAVAIQSRPELGYVYYGRLRATGEPSDKGKLRPLNNKPLPMPTAIQKGDVFVGTDIKQFRVGSSTDSATSEMAAGTCYSTVKVDHYVSDKEAEGAWLEVQVTKCP